MDKKTTANIAPVERAKRRLRAFRDLQEDIDIGVSRSTDGGRTWGPMIVAMDMGTWGGCPQGENGIGDPAILVDRQTGRIFIVAAWTHGLPQKSVAWFQVGNGFEPSETAQLMLSYSDDDGLTWSTPRSLTKMVKKRVLASAH